ncbi:MAG: iron-containing alcohol dehydrogenase [Chloroflexi bacterium]|nr:iron-containing alcohol dehydrogenase [Chloroflexota bacterium]
MTTIWNMPRIELTDLSRLREQRPAALLTGKRSWQAVNTMLKFPVVVQAEPESADRSYLEFLSENLPKQVQVVYAVGGGLASDAAKYIAWKRKLPAVLVPTALSVDGFFTATVSLRDGGAGVYLETGPAERVIIDWDVVSSAPAHIRGAGIVELLSIVTGLLDWRYAAEKGKNALSERFQPWAAAIAAGIAQQAFRIAKGVGEGQVQALRELLDLISMEVRLTTQIGHTRPQEGSEQFFAQAIQPRTSRRGKKPYAELVGPGILLAMALHNQEVKPIRDTMLAAGIRLNTLDEMDIRDTLLELPQFVKDNELPYSLLNDVSITSDKAKELIKTAGLSASEV